jgi:hypothetical protein
MTRYLRYLRLAFSAVSGLVCVLLLGASLTPFLSCREQSTSAKHQAESAIKPEIDIITFDTDAKGTLADALPPLDEIASITLSNYLKSLTVELPEKDWQNLHALFADTRRAKLNTVLVKFGEVEIRTRSGKTLPITIYGSSEFTIYALFADDGNRLGYFVPVKHGRNLVKLLPEWEEFQRKQRN